MTKNNVPHYNAKGVFLFARFMATFEMISGRVCFLGRSSGKAGIAATCVLILWLGAMSLPLMADGANAAPAGGEDFGQYLADHQEDLAPVFMKNAGDMFKVGMPLLIQMTGWIILFTMLTGWAIDVLMSRGFAFLFAPAFAELKRAIIYATGRLFLSFVYTCLIGLAVVFSLRLSHPGIVTMLVVILLLVVALAAQIVWILYLYRTDFFISAAFYVAILVVHGVVGFLIARPIISLQASSVATDFVDRAITPRLQAEAQSTKRELAAVESARNVTKAKMADLQNQIAQAQTDQEQLRKEIEAKKNSDIYVFGQIVQARARGELDSARAKTIAFLAKFPTSTLYNSARAQLVQVNERLAVAETQKRQEEADAARAAAQARADLLARAGKGEVTLSEMRQALIGKTRAEVSNLLGQPSETASDSWGYHQQMILNPLTNERYGLTVYFTQGAVQSVDYNRNGGSQ
jgi:DNA-binding transcriptional regulator YdaS (Cro superfamily)